MDEIDVVYIVTGYNPVARESQILGVYADIDAAHRRAEQPDYESRVWAWPTNGGDPIDATRT
ncbi:MAG: hypothetical protein ACOH2Q_20135 [Rhodococcus sp. (in: high G+C Gram-positive bacteria)]